MEKIIRLHEELRAEMKTYLEGLVSEQVSNNLDSMSTSDMYNMCLSLKDMKEKFTPKQYKGFRHQFLVYTDGGYSMKNKIGAGAFVILKSGKKWKKGGEKVENSTNNVAELTAVECALKNIPGHTDIKICTDSKYTIGVLSGNFTAQKNTELIDRIKDYIRVNDMQVTFEWVKGHSGNEYNELCDKLCDEIAGCDLNAEYAKYKK